MQYVQFLAVMCNDCSSTFNFPNNAGVPFQVVKIIHLAYNLIRIAVPIILIITGMIEMVKAINSKDEKEIKTAQTLLVKRGITAALVFLVVSLVGMIFNIMSQKNQEEKDTMWNCISSLLNGQCTQVIGNKTECTNNGRAWKGKCVVKEGRNILKIEYVYSQSACNTLANSTGAGATGEYDETAGRCE